jgi:[ribosomal protein S5]-alanine N-acetyltransferase
MLLKMTDLETACLHLREFRPDDLPDVVAWEETIHADQFLEFCFRSYREWGMGPWAMLLKASGALVGNCSFCRIGYDRAAETFEYCGEVNYYVAPRYRGAGLATEALQAALKFGFSDLKLTRIQGRCSPGNLCSERVMQKAGLKFERMLAPSAEAPSQDKLYAITRELYSLLPASPRLQP